jgi:hypothetical protein
MGQAFRVAANASCTGAIARKRSESEWQGKAGVSVRLLTKPVQIADHAQQLVDSLLAVNCSLKFARKKHSKPYLQ